MVPPFRPVIDAATKLIAKSRHLSRAPSFQRVAAERDAVEACDYLEALTGRQLAVGIPPCRPTFADGQTAFEYDVKQVLGELVAKAKVMVEAARAFPIPKPDYSGTAN